VFRISPDVEMYGLVLRWMERLNQEAISAAHGIGGGLAAGV
jgi:hypothetical protein